MENKLITLVCLSALLTLVSGHRQEILHLQSSSGILQGISENVTTFGKIHKFLGVPYAQAPVGSLRFQRPIPLNETQNNQHLDASKFGKTCPQYRHLTRFISPLLNVDTKHETSEDCLKLNLFIPADQQDAPIIIWIPGEGFDFADARQFDGSFLAAKTKAVVVTVQYRVGVLGFLSAPSLGIEGNMGLHDQLEAIRWVRRNAKSFGADPKQITVMGRFSGAMSISALISAPKQELIKTEEGELLFSKAAMLSGVAVPGWIINNEQSERVPSLIEMAKEKGFCSGQTYSVSCLKSMSVDQLLQISGYGWRLVQDNELVGSVSPVEAVKTEDHFANKLEAVLLGEAGQEGSLCLYRHMLQTQSNNYAQLIDDDRLTGRDMQEIIRDDLATYFGLNATQSHPISAAFESLASKDESELQSRDRYLNACSSFMVKSHSNRLKRNLLARNEFQANRLDATKRPINVHHYELKYKPSFSLAPDYIETAAHGDDVPLIFGLLHGQPVKSVSQKDLVMTNKMMNLIGSFVHGHNQQGAPSLSSSRRNWRSEAEVMQIDFDESDCDQLVVRKQQLVNSEAQSASELLSKLSPKVRIIVLDNLSESLRVQNLVEMIEEQRVEQIRSSSLMTKSQRLLELHRQNEDWQASTSKQAQSNLINESSFLTVMVFSSCVLIMAVLSLFIGFTLILFRNKMACSSQKIHRFASSPSSCDICVDSHPDNINNVLARARKDAPGFSNVFAKLRNQQPTQSSQPTLAQSSSTIAEGTPTSDLAQR